MLPLHEMDAANDSSLRQVAMEATPPLVPA
jgi:hypothetical protein